MKNYKEMAADVFRRREEFLRKRQRRNQILLRTGALSGFCVLLLSAGILVPAMTGKDFNPGKADVPLPDVPGKTSGIATTGSANLPASADTDGMESTMQPGMMDSTPAHPDETTGGQFGDEDPLPDLPTTDPAGEPSVPKTGGDDPVVVPSAPKTGEDDPMIIPPVTGESQSPSERPSDKPPAPQNKVRFPSYEELSRALRDENSDVWQKLEDYGSDAALFESFLSGFSVGELPLLAPAMSGEWLALWDPEGSSNITVFSHELYGMPWIWYRCAYQGAELTVRIAYPQILNNPGIDPGGSYRDLLAVIAPEAANPTYYLDKGYAAVYETDLTLGNGNAVSVMMLKANGGGMYVLFLYDGVMVMVQSDKRDLLSEEFFSEFSMKEFY